MTEIPHPISLSGKKTHTMPPLLLEVASLVTTRSVTNSFDPDPDPSDPYGSSGGLGKAAEAGVVVGAIAAFVLFGFLYYQVKRHRLLRIESKNFIFRRCCGERRKHGGPLEQNYQSYDMLRSQGQHHTEAGDKEGFENVPVAEA